MRTREDYKTPEWTSALAALIFGTITHMFGLVNVLHNYDDIAQQPRGYGTGVTSGRWLLSILGDIAEKYGGNYNLTFVNGLLFIILIACSAGLLVSVFHIRDRKMAALIGMLFVTFPSAFSTLAFRYTAVYYGIGIFLSVLAAWVLCRYKCGLLLSALCTCCSLGIYQAYVPITIGIFVLLLIQQALEGTTTLWKLLCRSLYDCVALLLGLLLYYLFLKITLNCYGMELSNYQGVGEMGKIAIGDIPALVWKAVYFFCMLPFKDYCGLASLQVIRIAYLLLGGVAVIQVVYLLLKKVKNLSIALFTAVLCLTFPVAVNFIVIMCPDSWIYTLMVYSFVLVACVPVILYECFPPEKECDKAGKRILKNGISILTAFLICCYSYQTNVNYSALYFSNRQVENYLNSMIVQVRMTEGFRTEMDWAFIGEFEDPLLNSYWQYEIDYGGIEFTQGMLQRYSWGDWVYNYYGYMFPMASEEKISSLKASEEVREMPCWPNEGAVKVIGDTVVIKCQELPPNSTAGE